MRRKRNYKKEKIEDPKYGNELVALFINHLMHDGKKSVAERVMYDALAEVEKNKKGEDPIEIFNTAISNITPLVEVKSKRVGGATYQVPCEVKGERKITLAMRWIISAARSKKGKPMHKKLSNEFLLALNKEGDAMKKRENIHKMAEANKAFAHFGW